jgi:peptidyl-prolyl cis-trans isomerase C
MDKKILATVNGNEITTEDVDNTLKRINPSQMQHYNTEQGKKQLLDELIRQELFYLDALENKLDNEESFTFQLEKIKVELLKQYSIQKLFATVHIEDKELLEHYNNNKSKYMLPESVKASHILVESEEKALELKSKIDEGLDFGEAAKEISSCPSKNNGGDLGYFSRGRMVPEFEAASFSMNINEISNPIKTQFGYHLIKVTDKKPAEAKPFDEVKNTIQQKLLQLKQQDLYIKKAEDLKIKYPVELL